MILTMKKITAIFAVSALAAVSCAKYEAPDPSITVTTDKTEYRAGEPVTFTFEGDPDNIVFYSGEYGHNYEDRHNYGRVGTLYFDFTSYSRYGTYIPGLEALVSTDFNGVYDLENVNKATWHELPAALPGDINIDNFPSGVMNINEFLEEKNGSVDPDANIYIAFHYKDYQDETRSSQSEWIIRSATLNIVSPDGEESLLADMSTFKWNEIPTDIDVTSARIRFFDIDKTVPSTSDDWTVSPAFSIGGIPADTGVPVKGIDTDISSYTYTYTEPGTYTAVFETSSIWYTGGSTSTASVTVTVLPAEDIE